LNDFIYVYDRREEELNQTMAFLISPLRRSAILKLCFAGLIVCKQRKKRKGLWRWLMGHDAVGVLNMDDMGIVRDRARGWSSVMARVEVWMV
jgi:hypothetical protein